jgi:biotin carboxyl carrier protein
LLDGRSYAASIAEQDSQTLDVTIGGESFSAHAQDERERTAGELATARPVAEVIKASMPGIVVSLTVSPGDVLQEGQAVGILEAMKMQNEVSAPHGGVVAEVMVETGQAVDSGQVLIRLESASDE